MLPRPTPYLVSYHLEHDIDRFLATSFLIVLLLLSAISYGSFLIFSKMLGLISYKVVSYEWAGTVYILVAVSKGSTSANSASVLLFPKGLYCKHCLLNIVLYNVCSSFLKGKFVE